MVGGKPSSAMGITPCIATFRHHPAGLPGVEVWAWVPMPNPVPLILVPRDADGLRRALAAIHRRYGGQVHARERG
jgi:putative transposase